MVHKLNMFCRKGTYSVVKINTLYSDVRTATTRMNNIGGRQSESTPDTNNPSYNLQNASPTFEELVFCPTGLANTSKYVHTKYDVSLELWLNSASSFSCCEYVNKKTKTHFFNKHSLGRQKRAFEAAAHRY